MSFSFNCNSLFHASVQTRGMIAFFFGSPNLSDKGKSDPRLFLCLGRGSRIGLGHRLWIPGEADRLDRRIDR